MSQQVTPLLPTGRRTPHLLHRCGICGVQHLHPLALLLQVRRHSAAVGPQHARTEKPNVIPSKTKYLDRKRLMSKHWSPEQRARQAAAIHDWKPWAASTGPTSLAGKIRSSRNAYKGGQRKQLRRLRAALRAQQQLLQTLLAR